MSPKKILIYLLLLLPLEAFGQVATSTLDPAFHNEGSAATSWRFGNAIGAGYHLGSGKTLDGENNDEKSQEITTQGSTFLASLQLSTFSLEAYSLPQQTYQTKDVSADTEETTLETFSESQVNLAVRGLDFVSIGVHYHSTSNKTDITSAASTATTDSTSDTLATTGLGGSVSLRFLNAIYVGGGVTRVTQTQKDTTDNSWVKNFFGGALLIGGPGSSAIFRAEYDYFFSPESRKSAEGSLAASYRPKFQEYRAAAELSIGPVVLSYKLEETVRNSLTVDNVELYEKYVKRNYYNGLVYRPPEGLTIGLYYISGTKTWDKTKKEESTFEYAATVGYTWF